MQRLTISERLLAVALLPALALLARHAFGPPDNVVWTLFCVAIAMLGAWLWSRSRWLAAAYALGFVAYAAMRDWSAWMARFVLER